MYNEFDPTAVDWLNTLVERNLITKGVVDGRSINDLVGADCPDTSHFFAGIGGWDYALHLAGWNPDEPVWTGSCPCQPFSGAGKRTGTDDPRHLWPEFFRLIKERRPPVIFGEQTASNLGREWLSGVRSDLEGLGYAVGVADICAASIGAPHRRSRLYWVADTRHLGEDWRGPQLRGTAGAADRPQEPNPGSGQGGPHQERQWEELQPGPGGEVRFGHRPLPAESLEHTLRGGTGHQVAPAQQAGDWQDYGVPGQAGIWDNFDVAHCRELDGSTKYRRVEPGTLPVAPRVSSKLGRSLRAARIRGFGNAINPYQAAAFIRAYLEARS